VNEAVVHLAGLELDMTQEHMRLSGPRNLLLLDRVSLNPIFADYLGGAINNPLFVDPSEAAGMISITLEELDRLPIDKTVTTHDPANDGRATVLLSVSKIQLGNPALARVQSAFQSLGIVRGNFLQSLEGDIRNYRVSIAKGVTSHDMTLLLGEKQRPLRLYGNVRMFDKTLMPVSLFFTQEFLADYVGDDKFLRLLPKGLELPLGGHLNSPQFDLGSAIQRNVGNIIQNPGELLQNPEKLKDLIGGFGGDKDKNKDKDKKRDR
jgi:hypothetical protein